MAQNGYAPKMDEVVSEAMKKWWLGLSKDEILAYLAEQPTVTADTLREMMSGNNCVLAFDIRFDTAGTLASTDFHTK